MLTAEQKKWLNHLNNSDSVGITAYNPKVKFVFKKIKAELTGILGEVQVLHKGSSALKISGQGEIDLYLPIAKKDFNPVLEKLKRHLGEPGSVYDLRRVRFVKYIDNTKIEIFIINRNSLDWKNLIKFEKYLKRHPRELKAYEKLKIDNAGRTTKDYYTKKTEFINKILKK
jgi:GrpB-like predicted nucleotidyltransferase (UPF0157 family)